MCVVRGEGDSRQVLPTRRDHGRTGTHLVLLFNIQWLCDFRRLPSCCPLLFEDLHVLFELVSGDVLFLLRVLFAHDGRDVALTGEWGPWSFETLLRFLRRHSASRLLLLL